MTPDFDAYKDSGHVSLGNSKDSRDMDILQRDRSELLSAYIDGEVTASERQQVQQWLSTDLQIQHLYARMIKLRQGLQTLPVPQSEHPAEQIANQVFARIAQRRTRRSLVWGGAALAALFIGALPNFLPRQSPALQVALNRPMIEIPKAAVAKPSAEGVNIYNKIDATEAGDTNK